VLAMLPLMALLLRAERRAMALPAPAAPVEERPLAGVGA
jgi:hypothetical protein